MRSTTDILVNYERENVDHKETLFTWETCESAMKEAQVEALKEVNTIIIQSNIKNRDKVRGILIELIKEIES